MIIFSFIELELELNENFCLSSTVPQLWNNLTKYLRIKNSISSIEDRYVYIHAFSTNYKKVLIHFYDDN